VEHQYELVSVEEIASKTSSTIDVIADSADKTLSGIEQAVAKSLHSLTQRGKLHLGNWLCGFQQFSVKPQIPQEL